jgi:hypothetical protein
MFLGFRATAVIVEKLCHMAVLRQFVYGLDFFVQTL